MRVLGIAPPDTSFAAYEHEILKWHSDKLLSGLSGNENREDTEYQEALNLAALKIKQGLDSGLIEALSGREVGELSESQHNEVRGLHAITLTSFLTWALDKRFGIQQICRCCSLY